MKIVLDTNVFVSGIFFKGPPYTILDAWRDGKLQLVISMEILEEYQRVGMILAEEYRGIEWSPIMELLIQNSMVYSAPRLPTPVCEDPDDDKFLGCALVSGSKVIVSGDRHLLAVSGYQNIEVLKPREFVNKYLA